MRTELFIAFRYFFSRRKLNFITIISYLSFLGITIGVAALIVVLSVFNGFSTLINSNLISLDPHIRVEASGTKSGEDIGGKLASIRSVLPEASVTPFVSGKVLLFNHRRTNITTLKGMDPEEGGRMYGIQNFVKAGKYSLQSDDEVSEAVLGLMVADGLGVLPGDTATMISPVGIEQAMISGSMPLMKKIVTSGIFYSMHNEYDGFYAFTDLATAQKMLGYNDAIQGYEITLPDVSLANEAALKLEKIFPPAEYNVNTWFDTHKQLFLVMKIERWAAYVLLSLIILVAVFNILASLAMSVMEKKRDIGILRSMGLKQSAVQRIFFIQGIIAGMAGTLLGFILGIFVYWLQITYKLYALDTTKFKIDAIPVELRGTDFLYVGIAAVGLSIIAAVIPARRAVRINALDAIRWE